MLLVCMITVFPCSEFEMIYEPAGEHLLAFDFSRDLQHWWAIVYHSGNGYRLVFDGKPHDWYEDPIDQFNVVMSDSGGHIAYVVSYKGRQMVVLDIIAQEEYDQICGEYESPLFSPDGQHLAYAAFDGEQWVVVHDGKASSGFQRVQAPTFSRDGQHWAFAGRKEERWFLVLDGKVKAEHDYIEGISFLPDNALRYVAVDDQRWVLIRGGKKGPAYEEISQITFSRDNQHFAYASRTGEKWRVIYNGKEWSEHDNVKNLTLSPSGKRVAYAAGTGKWVYDNYWRYYRFDGSFTAVLDEHKLQGGPDGYDVEEFMFSSDEAHLYYTIGKIGEQELVVVDATTEPAVHGIKRLVAASAADRIAYSIYEADDKHFVIAGGRRYGPFADVEDLGLNSDGEYVVFTAQQDGKWYVVINGKLQEPFDKISRLRWSQDQRSVGVIGIQNQALYRAVYTLQ